MITYLPYPDYVMSARALGPVALEQSLDDAITILNVLTTPAMANTPQSNNPAVRMWTGYVPALAAYANTMARAMPVKMRQPNAEAFIGSRWSDDPETWVALISERLTAETLPWWFGWPDLHQSHRAMLLRESPLHYRQVFPSLFESSVANAGPDLWPHQLMGQYRTHETGRHGVWSEWMFTDYRVDKEMTCRT
jgi:hypothetical protein